MASCLLPQPARVSIAALEQSEVTVLRYSDLEALFDSYPGWQRFGRKLLGNTMTSFWNKGNFSFWSLMPCKGTSSFVVIIPNSRNALAKHR